jgi:hypothetical protein
MRLHAQAIAEHGAAAERTRRIDRDHADRWWACRSRERRRNSASLFALRPLCSQRRDHAIDQRALAGAGRAGHAHEIRTARAPEDRADEGGAAGILVFDERDGARDRPRIALEHAVGERRRHSGHVVTTLNAELAEHTEKNRGLRAPRVLR